MKKTIKDIILVLSVFLLIGIFGGVERQTIADWKLFPAILLIGIIDLSTIKLLKERN